MTDEKSMLEEAKELAERIEKGNAEAREIQKKNEEIATRLMLGGHSQAGQAQAPAETFEEKWRREAKERYKGTGLDPT